MSMKTQGVSVSLKEIFILSLFLAIFLYSLISFLKIWNTTYKGISHFEYSQDRSAAREQEEGKEEEEEEEENRNTKLQVTHKGFVLSSTKVVHITFSYIWIFRPCQPSSSEVFSHGWGNLSIVLFTNIPIYLLRPFVHITGLEECSDIQSTEESQH